MPEERRNCRMKEQYEKPNVVEIDLEESFSFGIPPAVSRF
jgi:hypothetical protein